MIIFKYVDLSGMSLPTSGISVQSAGFSEYACLCSEQGNVLSNLCAIAMLNYFFINCEKYCSVTENVLWTLQLNFCAD